MASFPALFSGSAALYPLTEESRIPAGILQFTDFTEQRFVRGANLARFVLVFDGIRKEDRDAIEDFFGDRKGGFDATWDLTLGGVTYQNMCFESDDFYCRETEPELWTVTLPVR